MDLEDQEKEASHLKSDQMLPTCAYDTKVCHDRCRQRARYPVIDISIPQ